MHDSLWRLLRGVYAQSLLLIATPALRFKDHGSIKVLEEVVHESRTILKQNDSHQLVRQERLEAVCVGFPSPLSVSAFRLLPSPAATVLRVCACAQLARVRVCAGVCLCARAWCPCARMRASASVYVRSVRHKHTRMLVLGTAGDRQRRMHG